MVLLCQLAVIITVIELLGQTEIQHFHLVSTIEAGNLFAKAAFQHAIFQSHHHIVVVLQLAEQILIQPRDKERVDYSSINALFLQLFCRFLGQIVEIAEAYKGHMAALAYYLVLVQLVIRLADRTSGASHHHMGDPDCHRILLLGDRPIQHSLIFLRGSGGQINKIGDIAHQLPK